MSRHGKIAPNKSRVSVLLDDGDKAALAEMAKNDGRSLSNFLARIAERVASRESVRRACGIGGWPSDVARHTFASNLYALTGSIEDVARALLHHTTRITLKHYVAMGIKKAAARRFFGLRPA